MALNFRKYAQKGEAFVKKLAIQLGDPEDTARAGRILRAVLHAFRNQSTPDESMQMIAQLPMFIKAIYVDGWRMHQKQTKVRHLKDFLSEVKAADEPNATFDFQDDEAVIKSAKAVFNVIKEYVSEGEIDDIVNTLPKELRPLLEEA